MNDLLRLACNRMRIHIKTKPICSEKEASFLDSNSILHFIDLIFENFSSSAFDAVAASIN